MTRNATFWDRRRAAVEAEADATAAARQAAVDVRQQQALAEKSDDEILAELDLPDPETLTKGDDFAAFMAKAVPEHIRKRALRKLWRSNPVLACVDGLNDYDDDYLAGSYGNAPIQTSYQVGKGLLAHVLEVAQPQESSDDDLTPLDKEEKSAQYDTDRDPVVADEMQAPDPAADMEPAPQDADHGKPRRMVFHFDGDSA
ncbi:DUF3306 domain-containing protein [Roseovarius sp. M141]|uniref:DUF3306 domain-containing protein n=1 Tax=Roseovarius sp. M141 TaxID=2583806 RepID=UPI0020CFD514|nr:DUF3306 domain-containing protein [Roseovarius sp. M141]MCQ0092324.1 DUF3306 domain-containing protein [Roseovarius sp. M141]